MQGVPLKNNSKNLCIHRRVPVQRELSQAMIPGKHLVKVEIEKSVWESKMKNTLAYSAQATEASKSSVQKGNATQQASKSENGHFHHLAPTVFPRTI